VEFIRPGRRNKEQLILNIFSVLTHPSRREETDAISESLRRCHTASPVHHDFYLNHYNVVTREKLLREGSLPKEINRVVKFYKP